MSLFQKLTNLYRKTISPHRVVQNYIESNWDTPIHTYSCIGMKIKVWKTNKYYVVHTRQVRGDLIEVLTIDEKYSNIDSWLYDVSDKNSNSILHMGYVNQSHQYGFLLGFNDIFVHDDFDINEFLIGGENDFN